jgi:ribose 5-phosphate isomerase B
MKVFLGADHGGYELKEKLKTWLVGEGHEVEDCGAHAPDPQDDYPQFARCVAEKVAENVAEHRGIVLCRNGIGVSVVANKVMGVRCAHAETTEVARTSRADDDTNVLALAADYVQEQEAKDIAKVWLETPFSGEARHVRRLEQVNDMERSMFMPKA